MLDGAEVLDRRGDPAINGLDYDSRRIKPGYAFIAMKGETTDGNRFIDKAIELGAVAVVSDSESGPFPKEGKGSATQEIAWARVPHGRRALGRLSANFYGRPAEKLANTGVTGTNGKTTTSFLVESILNVPRKRTVLIGTVEYHLPGKIISAPHTTPESLELNQMFAGALKDGATEAVMEVSSHALEQQRVYGIPYDVAVFTNLTRDHLDYHQTMEAYFAAKQRLFAGAGGPPPRFAVLNRDDPHAREIKLHPTTKIYWYGLGPDSNLRARHINSSFQGLRFDVQFGKIRFAVESPLLGKINVYNILAACGAGLSFGIAPEVVARGIASLAAVPGRFERVDEGQPFVVAVDYAHTDDALRNTIAVARGLNPKRIITLFGCGGDRDRAKRPLMGKAAAEASDYVVLTSDNPRSEDPLAIMNDALVGIRRVDVPHIIEPDRATAIARALKEAHEGDVVILAGKGHETYQVLKDRTIPFDDRAVARDVLRGYGYRKAAGK